MIARVGEKREGGGRRRRKTGDGVGGKGVLEVCETIG
jgi:hypothetical protein